MTTRIDAPELVVSRWFNTSEPLTLAGLRGRVVMLHAFQMLCPGPTVRLRPGEPIACLVKRIFRSSASTPFLSTTPR